TLPLSALAQQLASKQAELDRLRRTYETRLADLLRRKNELESSLRQVEAEIQVAAQGPGPSPAAAPAGKVSLPNLIVAIVREKGKPVTIKELVEELDRRSYPTNSGNLSKMVGNRLHDLVKKKVLARFGRGRGKGVVLARSGGATSTPKKAAAPSRVAANGAAKAERTTLPTLITSLLARSSGPVRAIDLARLVLKAGYKTKSKSPVDLIWAAVGKMDNVENVRGKGYRLKK